MDNARCQTQGTTYCAAESPRTLFCGRILRCAEYIRPYGLFASCQKATALAAATLRESTPWDIGILAV